MFTVLYCAASECLPNVSIDLVVIELRSEAAAHLLHSVSLLRSLERHWMRKAAVPERPRSADNFADGKRADQTQCHSKYDCHETSRNRLPYYVISADSLLIFRRLLLWPPYVIGGHYIFAL